MHSLYGKEKSSTIGIELYHRANMVEFKGHLGADTEGRSVKVTIASGPIIIEDGKVLLDKHGEDGFWKFPGGRLRDAESMHQTAMREAKEELGIDVELVRGPFVVAFEREDGGVKEHVILIHYLALRRGDITPGRDVTEWGWHDINNLPDDCAPNVKLAVDYFLEPMDVT